MDMTSKEKQFNYRFYDWSTDYSIVAWCAWVSSPYTFILYRYILWRAWLSLRQIERQVKCLEDWFLLHQSFWETSPFSSKDSWYFSRFLRVPPPRIRSETGGNSAPVRSVHNHWIDGTSSKPENRFERRKKNNSSFPLDWLFNRDPMGSL